MDILIKDRIQIQVQAHQINFKMEYLGNSLNPSTNGIDGDLTAVVKGIYKVIKLI